MRLWIVAVAFGLLAACAPTRTLRAEDIRPIPESAHGGHVSGLRAALDGGQPDPFGEPAPPSTVRVFLVHGIREDNRRYSERWQNAIIDQLSSDGAEFRETRSEPIQLHRGYSAFIRFVTDEITLIDATTESSLTRHTWTDANNASRQIVFYEFFWAPLRDQMKYEFFGCFDAPDYARAQTDRDTSWTCNESNGGARPNSDSRTMLNSYLKDSLLVGGFADAVIEIGAVGDVLRDDTDLALCIMARDELEEANVILPPYSTAERCDLDAIPADRLADAEYVLRRAQNFAITHSLGSQFFLSDQIRRSMAFSEQPSNNQSLSLAMFDDATVYMFANQVALLNFSMMTAACTPTDNGTSDCPNPYLDESTGSHFGPLTTYVAFNDADDLLGFELPPYLAGTFGGVNLINISVRNPGFQIRPFFKSPTAAHGNQADNPAIISAIVEGFDVPARAPATRTER
jgi:hypothetical protein